MLKAIDYIFAARPLLHLPVWSVYLVVRGGSPLTTADLMCLAGLSVIVAGAYYLNQIFDEENDRINSKLGFLQTGMASRRSFWILFAVTSVAGLATVASVSPYLLIPVGIQFLLGVVYSVPLFRLKDRPWLGLLTNALCFGWLVPVVAQCSLLTTEFHWLAAVVDLSSPYFFLAVAATHIMTTLPDREGDAASGKRTVAVVLSSGACHLLAAALLLVATGVAFLAVEVVLELVALIGFGIVLASYFVKTPKLDLLAAKLPILLLTIWAGWIYPYYAAFVVALIFVTRVYYCRRFGITYPKLA